MDEGDGRGEFEEATGEAAKVGEMKLKKWHRGIITLRGELPKGVRPSMLNRLTIFAWCLV